MEETTQPGYEEARGLVNNVPTEPTTQDPKLERNRAAPKLACTHLPAICTPLALILIILHGTLFIVGISTTKECPARPMIPIYLIVTGIVGLVTKAVPFVRLYYKKVAGFEHIAIVLLCFEIIWTVLGSYWIYSIYQPGFSRVCKVYCHKTTYLLAFWWLTVTYLFAVIFIVVIPCSLGITRYVRTIEMKMQGTKHEQVPSLFCC